MLAFANSVAKLCIDKYNAMKKTGKPDNNEWTVLAGIILINTENVMSIVSLATGTKCLSGVELTNTKLYEIGERLSDSHAEILARRGFLLQTPCGDCSIIPMNKTVSSNENIPTKKQKFSSEMSIETNSTSIEDIHRTGAKCLPTETRQDLRLSGKKYHATGALRTKPGRGDPTLSLSCSDKIAKWNAIGIQGSLLSTFVASMRLKTIVIGGGCPFSQEVMERGIYKRFGDDLTGPDILQAGITFPCMRNSVRSRPCPSSIVWSAVRNGGKTEITVDGRKQGATKNKKGSRLLISRKTFLKTFLQTLDKSPLANKVPSHPKKMYYHHCKQWRDSTYQREWKHFKATKFTAWPDKPMGLQSFSL